MMRSNGRLPAAALMGLVALGCSDSTNSDTARVSIALTDRAGDVEHVWIELGEIYLQGGGESGRVTLLSEDDAAGLGLIELTELSGTTLELVSDVEIPAANYGQLRFVIVGAVLQTADGVYTLNATPPDPLVATGSLNCPSCTNTGIKVLLPGDVANLEGGSHLIVLDFDVSQSFGHPTGQPTLWVMHPVIRGAELGFTGNVHGTVALAEGVEIPECPAGTPRDLTSFIPQAVAQNLTDDSGALLTVMTTTAADGSFSFSFLHPDEYDFGYVTDVDFGVATLSFVATAPGLMQVGSGTDQVVSYTITGASCS